MRSTWLCDLAHQMHRATEATLSSAAASNGRRQLSEEFVTYKLMDIVDHFSAGGCPIWIQDFGRVEESANGADLELWFWDRKGGSATGWLVQAKRLSAPGTKTSSPRFASIGHKVGDTPQVELLISAAAAEPGLTPIYWLYSWDFPAPTPCTGLRGACPCTPSSFDDALLVAPAAVISGLAGGRTWHSVVVKNRNHLESLRRMWCHAGGSVPALARKTAALRPVGGVLSDSDGPPTVEQPPLYVLDAFRLRDPGNARDVNRRSSARQLALFEL